ncbi:beta-N-acetylhexosaminidase [Deinococcus irradiatisoli]|uniref:Beta-N-acetylhexosaminidase n=2 Tax=Deinococcus irradiatisoli TaxID=2202254 RepID=A0A2Z3JGP3_9DEIO|nr:beta-N-acetylhexosaminidase [Deinococcus irradiatisoli]
MVDLPGPHLDPATADYLRANGIRAVCLFGKNVESEAQLRALCRDLRDVMGEEALIAIDHEGGAIVRPTFWPAPPSAMSLGHADDPQLTEDVSAGLARQLRSVGINWNFAPVLDVNVNPRNPVIAERSFGASPQTVARHGRAALRGLAREGVAGCVKHFPGHGDTQLDSHLALPCVTKSRAELDELELWPFRDALPQAPAVMTAHIVYDALDSDHPATLSRPILTDLLRGEWGYGGVVITDSMGMQAIDAHYGRGEAAVLSLRAGADMVMALGRREVQEATLKAVQDALDAGLDVSDKLERLSALARRFPVQIDEHAALPGDEALFGHAWRRGLNFVGDPQPVAPGGRLLLVAQRKVQRENVSEASVDADVLAGELSGWYDVRLHAYDDPAELDWPALRAQAGQEGRHLILATAHRHRHAALGRATPDLHLALYNPYATEDVAAPAVQSFGFRPLARAAAWAWLRGAAL